VFKNYRRLWLGLAALIIFTPLGLLATGTAFGEWSFDQLVEEGGFIPAGLERMAGLWPHAPLADYALTGFNGSFMHSAAGYVLSALAGVLLIVGIFFLFSKMVEE